MKYLLPFCLFLYVFVCWNISSAYITHEKISFQEKKPLKQEGFVTCNCGFALVTRKIPIKDLKEKFSSLKRHHTCLKNYNHSVCDLPNICEFCLFKMTICCRVEKGHYNCTHGHIIVKNEDLGGSDQNGGKGSHPMSKDFFTPPPKEDNMDKKDSYGGGESQCVTCEDTCGNSRVDWMETNRRSGRPEEDYGVYLPIIHLTGIIGQGRDTGEGTGPAVWDKDEVFDENFDDEDWTEEPDDEEDETTETGEGEETETPGEDEEDITTGEGETPGEDEEEPTVGEGEETETPGEDEEEATTGEGETPGEDEEEPTVGEGEEGETPGEDEEESTTGEGDEGETPEEGEEETTTGENEEDEEEDTTEENGKKKRNVEQDKDGKEKRNAKDDKDDMLKTIAKIREWIYNAITEGFLE